MEKNPLSENWTEGLLAGSERLQAALFTLSGHWGPIAVAFSPGYFVYRSLVEHVGVDPAWAVPMTVGLELVGVSISRTSLRLYAWNKKIEKARMKAEFRAPLELALGAAGIYLAANTFLTLALEVAAQVGKVTLFGSEVTVLNLAVPVVPVMFLIVAASAYGIAALAQNQVEREEAYAEAKIEAKASKAARAAGESPEEKPEVAKVVEGKPEVDRPLPAWLPELPEKRLDLAGFRRLIAANVAALPEEGLKATDLAELNLEVSGRTLRAWAEEARRIQEAAGQSTGVAAQNGSNGYKHEQAG